MCRHAAWVQTTGGARERGQLAQVLTSPWCGPCDPPWMGCPSPAGSSPRAAWWAWPRSLREPTPAAHRPAQAFPRESQTQAATCQSVRAGRAAVRSTHVGVLLEQHAVAVRAAAVLPGEPREVVLAFGAAVWEPRPKTPAQKKKVGGSLPRSGAVMTQAERLRRLRGRVPNVGDVQVEAGSVADVHRFVAVNCVVGDGAHAEAIVCIIAPALLLTIAMQTCPRCCCRW